jgi:fatty-acyl-CoA synthase
MSQPRIDAPLTLGAQLEARAGHADLAGRVALRQGSRSWTWRELRDHAVRCAHFLLARLGPCDEARPGSVALLSENHPEFLALHAGCGYAGLTLFALNTGLRGETLAGVLNQSRARLLVVEARFLPEIERIRGRLEHVAAENLLVLRPGVPAERDPCDLLACLAAEVGPAERSLDAPSVQVRPEADLVVLYTSGTTGLPKGIRNNHLKLLLIGLTVARQLDLGPEDVGYACMPLFHSNSLFLGFHPAFCAGGTLSLRERFSAREFVPDVLRYGATFWNYVGEPVHYVLRALEQEHGGDEARILAEVAGHPANRLRYALGNGASPPDIERFVRWLGLEDMFELYGSTEAAISTFRRRGDPRGSLGEVSDPAVRILDARGQECPPAQLDASGRIANRAEAVGEICRVGAGTGLFQGYFSDPAADAAKLRGGVYHSGDLGHILVQDGRRHLFFDGRTEDWIRKDGENFSAAPLARRIQEHPDVELAAAYGVPCAVSDELVMVALQLREGARFDPAGFFRFCEREIEQGGMEPKWLPDFVRLVDEFEFTETQKLLVRRLKQLHFDRRRLPEAALYWRRRGDRSFQPFTSEDYEALRQAFAAAERLNLLDA